MDVKKLQNFLWKVNFVETNRKALLQTSNYKYQTNLQKYRQDKTTNFVKFTSEFETFSRRKRFTVHIVVLYQTDLSCRWCVKVNRQCYHNNDRDCHIILLLACNDITSEVYSTKAKLYKHRPLTQSEIYYANFIT